MRGREDSISSCNQKADCLRSHPSSMLLPTDIGDYHTIVVWLLVFLQQQNSLKRTFLCTNVTRFATHFG